MSTMEELFAELEKIKDRWNQNPGDTGGWEAEYSEICARLREDHCINARIELEEGSTHRYAVKVDS